MSPERSPANVRSEGRDPRIAIGLALFVLVNSVIFGILICKGAHPEPKLCLQKTGLVTVGETVKMEVGRRDLSGECRPDRTLAARFTWQVDTPERSYSWQTGGETIDLRADGTVRGLAPGAYAVVGRHAQGTERDEGVVLPAGWTMSLEPKDTTIAVGESVRYRVRVLGPAGESLDGVPFSAVPGLGHEILRLSGLAAEEWVELTAIAPGRATIAGHVAGGHSVTTSLTVVEQAARDK